MRGSLSVRRSRLADWARLSGALSLPVVLLALGGANEGLVDGRALIAAALLGCALALIAVVLGISALVAIWTSGAPGARSAALGMLYASPVLLTLAIALAALVVYPRLAEVTTDPLDPPRFSTEIAPVAPPSQQAAAAQMIAYPDLAPHLYAVSASEVQAAVLAVMEERGWTIESRGPTAAAAGPAEPIGAASGTVVPNEPAETTLRAMAPMPLLDIAGEVAVRLRETPDGTRVDVRSRLGAGTHDLGQNARRIRGFLSDLDARLAAS
jgi:hypothetical protein